MCEGGGVNIIIGSTLMTPALHFLCSTVYLLIYQLSTPYHSSSSPARHSSQDDDHSAVEQLQTKTW